MAPFSQWKTAFWVKGQRVSVPSKAFAETLDATLTKGYEIEKAVVHCIVSRTLPDTKETLALVLPVLSLRRKATAREELFRARERGPIRNGGLSAAAK